MREIKFRAWSNVDKAMFYDVQSAYDSSMTDETGKKHDVMDSFGQTLEMPERYIVEQYTGLKDKNGKEIYEGDILNDSSKIPYTVVFSEDFCGFVAEFDEVSGYVSHERLDCYYDSSTEIIGNIHDGGKQP
jgi:uncharacterized phage protein (TIGR01671 family)